MNRPNYQRYGNMILDRSRSLGSGTYGGVYRGYIIQEPTKKGPSLLPVAIKESFYEPHNIQQVTTLQILNHPNIIQYIDYRVHGNKLFMVMELCEQGTLEDFLMKLQKDFENAATMINPDLTITQAQPNHIYSKYTEKVVQYYSQIVQGIRFMYNKNILHRDLKPSNILLRGNIIKIADFGTSKMKVDAELKTLVGTPLFCSPELLQLSLGEQETYTEKSDIWSLGLILYVMFNYQKSKMNPGDRLKESLPWKGKNTGQIIKNIRSQPLNFKNEFIPQNYKKIISKMLTINVQQRMSFKQFLSLQQFQLKSQITDDIRTSNKGKLGNQKDSVQDKKIELVEQKDIDQQLLAVLEMEMNQKGQLEQLIEFYHLIIEEIQGQQDCSHQLIFQLYLNLYRVLGPENGEERDMIAQKFFQRQKDFKRILQNEDSPQAKQQSDINLMQAQLTPTSELLNQCKFYIKKRGNTLPNSQNKKANTKDCRISINTVYGLYDICTLLSLETAWLTKRKQFCSMHDYRTKRSYVSIWVLIDRIKVAIKTFKLNS